MDEKLLQNKYTLVTGASSGHGYSMTEALLQESATVTLASRSGSKLDEAVRGLKEERMRTYA